MVSKDRLNNIEFLASKESSAMINNSTILEMVETIRFLEARQTELQKRNTELVLMNRELQRRRK